MAHPDNVRNTQLRCDKSPIVDRLPRDSAIAQVNTKITEVRIASAKFESTAATPFFARIAVAAAKAAESKDQETQFTLRLSVKPMP